MLVDSHCHLDLVPDHTPDALIATAQASGISHFLCVSVDLDNAPIVLGLAKQFSNVYASAGLHPNTPPEQHLDSAKLITLADHPEVIAIGETGLDYHYHKGDLAWQHERFRQHIRVARELKKPLIIHTRDAKEDTLKLLAEEKAQEVGGIMHCFVEDWETAQQAMELGFYISFSGVVTFKKAEKVQHAAKNVPLERMLVETDCPYLAPVPYRGKTNQPAYVKHVAEFIAKLRDTSVETVAEATTANFFRLFKMEILTTEMLAQ